MAKEDKYKNIIIPNWDDIKRYISCGVTEEQVYQFYSISKTQWWRYKKSNESFAKMLNKAKEKLKADLISKAYQIAMGTTIVETREIYEFDENKKEILVKKVVNKKEIKPDSGMIQFLLINRFPDEFSRDPQGLEIKRQNASNAASKDDEKVEGI